MNRVDASPYLRSCVSWWMTGIQISLTTGWVECHSLMEEHEKLEEDGYGVHRRLTHL